MPQIAGERNVRASTHTRAAVAAMILLVGWITIEPRTAAAQSATARTAPYIYCGKTFKSMILFQKPDFHSALVSTLGCGEVITVLSEQGYWARVLTQSGLVGYEPTWFVGPPRVGTPSKSAKCNRPPPLDNVDQFERLSAFLDRFIKTEKFTPEDFQSVSREDIEKLAASSYFAAYLTAEKPSLVRDVVSKALIDKHIFGKDFASLSPIQQINAEIWLQKLLNVLSKAIDLGFQDGSKYPCSLK